MRDRIALFVTMLAGTILAACSLNAPIVDEYYGKFELNSADVTNLMTELSTASNSIKIAMRTLDDSGLIATLNSIANRGIEVNIVLDNESFAVTNYLSPAISFVLGNRYGVMDSNFFIKDGKNVYQLTTADVSGSKFLMMKMSDIHIIEDYSAEFSQMFDDLNFGSGNDYEDKKIRANYRETYDLGQNVVGVYFLPAQPYLEQISTRIGSADESLEWVLSGPENQYVYQLWDDALRSGIGNTITLDSDYVSNIAVYPNFAAGVSKTILTGKLGFNAMFFDLGTLEQSVVITSCDLGDHRKMDSGDGVLITVTGPLVAGIYQTVEGLVSEYGTTNLTVTAVVPTTNVAYTNVIVNELVRAGIQNNDGDRFALAKMIELKNLTTNLIDLTGFKIVITNGNRVSEPATFYISSGTLLQPNGYFVIVAENYAYRYYDVLWYEFYLDSSFTITLVDSRGKVIDHIGQIYTDYSDYWDLSSGTDRYIYSWHRIASPLGSGTNETDWQQSSARTNMFDSYSSGSASYVTPGAY